MTSSTEAAVLSEVGRHRGDSRLAGILWSPWRYRIDVLAVAWIAVFVFLYLSPALKDGLSFGPADLGRGLSLLTKLTNPPTVHNFFNADTITQGVPWNTLDWQLVHRGELPLWNGLSGTGLPQMFNFESAPLSLATIVGYLFPLSMSFLATVAAKLFIAGTGVYVACRLLGTGPLAGAFGGTTFMLSGAFSGWLGWSIDGPVAWGGWILAGAVLAYRSRCQVRDVVLLAVAIGFSVYGGFPESEVLLAIGLGVVLVATGVARVVMRQTVRAVGVVRIGIGVATGGALAAPLLLPGVPLLVGSVRNTETAAPGIPLHLASLVLAQGFYGLPIAGSTWFGDANYYESAAYVGVIAIVLAGVAVLALWRRAIVVGLFVSVIAELLMIYRIGSGATLQKLFNALGLGTVALQRMQLVLELSIAVLAALGLQVVIEQWRRRAVRMAFLASSLAVVAALGILWHEVDSVDRSRTTTSSATGPSMAMLEALRRSSLIWPTSSMALVTVLLVAAAMLRGRSDAWAARAALAAGLALLTAQSAFLLFAGVGINSYSSDPFPTTPAVSILQKILGTKLLGLDGNNTTCGAAAPRSGADCGVRLWRQVGFSPEMNLGYGLDELAMHDPTIPQAYFDAWPVHDADQRGPATLNLFAPDVDTVALAQRYGVSYVLVLPGVDPPDGMHLVATMAGEGLYAVPNGSRFSFINSARVARVISSSQPDDAQYRLHVDVHRTSKLSIHVTDVEGWHAFADGKALALMGEEGDLMQVTVPAGTRIVELYYWPARFTVGLVLAAVAAISLVSWSVVLAYRRRRAAATPTGLLVSS